MEQRPTTPPQVKRYLEQHGLETLFKDLLAAVIHHRPERPLDFFIRGLQEIQRKRDDHESFNNAAVLKELIHDSSIDNLAEEDPFSDPFAPQDSHQPLNSGGGLSDRFHRSTDMLQVSFNRMRRGSVSAESVKPTEDGNSTRVIVPKSDEARMRIASAIRNNFLFRNLEEDQRHEVVDAMFEKKVPRGVSVINQGEEGDNFYVVDSGSFDVFVNGKKVVEIKTGGSFGELALMYNQPRAATVTAAEDSVLWAVDRVTFRRCIVNNTSRKRKLYEGFLRTVNILQTLETAEIVKIADALEPVEFEDGDIIVEQGDQGDSFYIVVEGEAIVTKAVDGNEPAVVKILHPGDYFGEVALINDSPRAATVTAKEHVKCVTFDKGAFIRLLGPILDLLKRNMDEYKKYQIFEQVGQ